MKQILSVLDSCRMSINVKKIICSLLYSFGLVWHSNLCMQFHQVGSQTSVVDMVPEDFQPSVVSPDEDLKALQWEVFLEKPGTWGYPDFNITGFVDNINTTKDITDYLWVTTRFGRDNSKMHLTSFILFSIIRSPFSLISHD